MWKKGDASDERAVPGAELEARGEGPAARPAPLAPPRLGERATIGRSITIRGEVTGDEDLVIEGRVDGAVALAQHSVTVGPEGRVKANISGRVVTVEGRVEGDITGDEQIILRHSSWVEGDILAPRVVLEDGAHFRGGVEMSEVGKKNDRAETAGAKLGAAKPTDAKPAPAPSPAAPPPSRVTAPREVAEAKR